MYYALIHKVFLNGKSCRTKKFDLLSAKAPTFYFGVTVSGWASSNFVLAIPTAVQ